MTRGFADAAIESLRSAAPDGRAGAADGAGEIDCAVLRVADAAGGATVIVERAGGGVRASCSCGRPGCSHLRVAAKAFLGPQPAAASSPPRPSDLSAAPPDPAAAATGSSPADLASVLGGLLDALIEDGVGAGSERVDSAIESLVRSLRGADTYGLHRSIADLRRELSTATPSPDRVLRAVEVLAATRDALDAAAHSAQRTAHGEMSPSAVLALLVGRDVPLAEAEIRQDMSLLEIARNSARTPFGYRREERFLIDLATGARYAEMIPDPLDGAALGGPDRYRGSVGPFPRLIRGDLAAIEPGPDPRRIRLLQYRVELPVGADDLRRLPAWAASGVAALYADFVRLADAVGCPYPCFAVFAPARVVFRGGEAALLDAADRILPLARATAPDTCAAADRILARGRPELVIGHLLLYRNTLTLSPLAILIDLPRGERLLRLR